MNRVWKIFSRSDGYTYMETFITIIILGLITATLYTQYSRIEEFLLMGQKELQLHSDNLNLRLVMLEEVQKIKHPWFLKEYLLEEEEGVLKLFYYKGDPELFIDFIYGDDGIIISNSDGILFQSEHCNGSFEFEEGKVYYRDQNHPYMVSTCITL